MTKKSLQYRQGDVLLIQVPSLPKGAVEIPLEKGRIVLAHGEVTGHAHAIADESVADQMAERASEMADAIIARAKKFAADARKAVLYVASGEWYLLVSAPTALRHEEHSAITLAPTCYLVPIQVQENSQAIRRVAD